LKSTEWVPDRCHQALRTYYNHTHLDTATAPDEVFLALNLMAPRGANYLATDALFYNYIIKEGRRIAASQRANGVTHRPLHSTLVKVKIGDVFRYGEVVHLFEHSQSGHHSTMFAEMHWFHTLDTIPIREDVWSDL
jgi:hypothetical protein